MIPGITDTDENLAGIRAITTPDEVEYLPYNNLAGAKYAYLRREYPLTFKRTYGIITCATTI